AEGFSVRQLECGIERAPENNSGDKAGQHQKAQTENRAWPTQHVPEFEGKSECTLPEGRLRGFGRRHRCPPGPPRLSRLSISTKSFSIGTRTLCWGTWHCVQKYRRGEIDARNCPSRSAK